MESHVEIERKYDVDELTAVPALAELVGTEPGGVVITSVVVEEGYDLEAEYFDTTAFDLASRRIALRRRVGGVDEGWHLKLPADEGRTELQWPLDTAGPARPGPSPVPSAVIEPVREIVGDAELRCIARLSTRRTTIRVLDAEGAGVAEVADDLVIASEIATGTERRWREWEAELLEAAPASREGRTALLDAVERLLLAAGARPAASSSKLATALGRTTL